MVGFFVLLIGVVGMVGFDCIVRVDGGLECFIGVFVVFVFFIFRYLVVLLVVVIVVV